ncbi:MAG: N-acetyltransferase [Simkaniaceae bacterium]|nr:N-acetyltransferase [Simkaniaceae bacterium]
MKKSVIRIRNTRPEDLARVEEWLLHGEILDGFPMVDRRETDDALRFWGRYIEHKMSITALYKKNQAGCANLYVREVEKLKHQCLFVIVVGTEYRGKGIGTILTRELERLAKEVFHIEILHLEVYENNPAIALYERLGFKRYGVHPQYLKNTDGSYYDKILMEKSLI